MSQLDKPRVVNGFAEYLHCAAVWFQQAVDMVKQSRFSAAALTQDCRRSGGRDLQRNIIENQCIPEIFCN